jgi:release factor glutamine methyltransferase
LPETSVSKSVSVSEALAGAAFRLADAGCDTPRLDAEVLLAFVLGVGRERLVLDAHQPLGPSAVEAFEMVVARRVAREPVAYITGRREFRRLSLAVDRRVLIPRPETELLVEVGLGLEAGTRVADIGTGSGAVALALKDERPDLDVVGVDVSGDALAVARANAVRLRLDVAFVQGDLLSAPGVSDVEAVLANLPYVAEGAELAPEIASYEPSSALFAGVDGLDVVRRLVATLPYGVRQVALEVGSDQASAVGELVAGAGFATIERVRDLAGHERVVVGRR